MNRNLERLACGSCGASLDVPDGVKFVSCLHCGSTLQVRHNESVAYTEVVEKLEEHAEQIAELQDQLRDQSLLHEYLMLQSEVTALDENWKRIEDRFAVIREHGERILPRRESYQTAMFLGGLGAAASIVLIGKAVLYPSTQGRVADLWLWPFLLLGGAGALLYAYFERFRVRKFEWLQSEYWRQRAELLRQMSLVKPQRSS